MGISQPRNVRQLAKRTAAAIAAAILLLLLVCWMAYRHIPAWYRPVYVPIEREQAARDRLGEAFTALSRGMGKGRRFEFVVRQDELNQWLVARDRIWPASKRWIPDEIDDPLVVFEDGRVIVAGTWTGPGPRTVINIHLRVDVRDGELRAVVESVRGGSLPIPLWPIKRELARLERGRDGGRRELLPDGTSLVDAVEGGPLPRDIPWSQPRGKFRVEALALVPGELRVSLQPIERRVSSR